MSAATWPCRKLALADDSAMHTAIKQLSYNWLSVTPNRRHKQRKILYHNSREGGACKMLARRACSKL